MSNIKVAVRVRPLNKKEKDEGSKEIIQVNQDTLSIENVKLFGITDIADSRERIKHFVFDHCYDCMAGDTADSSSSQAVVFQDLGKDVLQAAFAGFNACVFAYGQTGTGKTYSMMGHEEDVGLIPRICESLFSHVAECADDNVTCRIDISYFEIYNERVRDLLQPELLKQNEKYSLKVREHPKEGPYVKDLSWHRVRDNDEIQALLDTGNDYRVTAETYMHDHSSRSHAIVTVCFTQARLEENRPSEIVSKIHMVDLAGSERADPSSKPGFRKRLTEGANINRSLVTLGYVIKALAEKSLLSWSTEDMGSMQNFQSSGGGESMATSSPSGPNKQRLPYIPYRDSVLTWLLKDSLGGNSKTIMIATVTPASQYYSETISTLRYAQRAKNIINKPRVNEDSNVALIRELRKEIERLHSMLADAQASGNLLTLPDSEDSRIAERLHENEEMAKQLTQSWMCKWSSTHDIMKESDLSIRGLRNRTSSMGVMIDSQLPYLVAMDDDILSTGVCIFHLKEGETLIGREDADREQDIVLAGPHIEKEHCFIQNLDGIVTMMPSLGAMCAVQGIEVTEPTRLSQGDFLVLGGNQVFRFNNPTEAAKLREHRRSQGSLNTLSTSYLSFGGLSRASSYNSIMSEDPSSLSPHSQYLKSSYPKRRHSDHVLYAAADLCLDLERRYKSENERIEEARNDLKKLREEHEKSEEIRQEKEEQMYHLHEQHRQEIEEQRRHLAQLIEENQRAREKAEEELELARESLAKEKEAFQKQLAEERVRLKQIQSLEQSQESLAVQTEPLQTSSIATDPDLDVFSQGTQDDLAKPKYSGGRKLSADDQLEELDRMEFERKLSYRETEQSLSILQEDLEDQYNTTQEKIEAKIEKIKQIEEQYKELDKEHLKEISAQNEKLEGLRKKESQLEVYIEEKEELMKVQTDQPRPLRNATSEMFLLNPQLQDIKFPQKTTSLSDIQADIETETPLEQKTLLSASSESLKSPISPVAMEITAQEADETAKSSTASSKRRHVAEDKHSKITDVARDVTSRLYKPPEPKFKYVPKTKDKDTKTLPAKTRVSREKDVDNIGRGSSPRTLKDSDNRHSPSPLRDAGLKGQGSPARVVRDTDKRHSPSPLRDAGKRASPSPSKEKGKPMKTTSSKEENTKAASKKQTDLKPTCDTKRKGTVEAVSKTDRRESPVMAVRNKPQYQNDTATAMIRRSPDRLGFVATRLGGSSPLRQMASASSLASVPESLSEEECGPLGASGSSEPVIKKRTRRGRAFLDDDEFRRHSAPDYDKLESEFNAYTKEMGFKPGERHAVSVASAYQTSVSVDESALSDSHYKQGSDKTAPSPETSESIRSESYLPMERLSQKHIPNSEFYISSSDEMTCDEMENKVDDTRIDTTKYLNQNKTDTGLLDMEISHADNKTGSKSNSMVVGIKRDHEKTSECDNIPLFSVKKSKSDNDKEQLETEQIVSNNDDTFSDDSLDTDHSADSLEHGGKKEGIDRLTVSLPEHLFLKDEHTKLVSDDSLKKLEDEQHVVGDNDQTQFVPDKNIQSSANEKGNDNRTKLDSNVSDTELEFRCDLKPDGDNIESSSLTALDTNVVNVEEIEPMMETEESERFIVSLDIFPYVDVVDPVTENQYPFDIKTDQEQTSGLDSGIDNLTCELLTEIIPSDNGNKAAESTDSTNVVSINLARDMVDQERSPLITNESLADLGDGFDNLTYKSVAEIIPSDNENRTVENPDSTNVVSINVAKDMMNQERLPLSTNDSLADTENLTPHEELTVNLLLEGEKMLKHEELEVVLKLDGETCVLPSDEKASGVKTDIDSEDVDKIALENEPCNIQNMDITEVQSYSDVEMVEQETVEDMEPVKLEMSVKNTSDVHAEGKNTLAIDAVNNEAGTQSECKKEISNIKECVSSEISNQNKVKTELEVIEPDANQDREGGDRGQINDIDAEMQAEIDLIETGIQDGISATLILPQTRTLAVWTSQEFMAEVDVAGSHGSDDSIGDPQQELQVLQEALEQLPAKSSAKDGPQLSTARRAARQRAMIRKELRTTDSDGVSAQSDESPASGNLSKSSSRPGSGSRRRRRPNGRGVDLPNRPVNEHTTDEYVSSDSDSLYSDDSLQEYNDGAGVQGRVIQNGDVVNGPLEKIASLEYTEVESSEMLHQHYKSTHQRRHSPRPRQDDSTHEVFGPDGKRSVGMQTFGRSGRFYSESSTKTDTSEDFDISFASRDYSSLGRNMVMSPLSLWNSNNREEGDLSAGNSSSSAGVVLNLSDVDRSMTPTPRSSARSSTSVFSLSSNLDKGPTEVWSSSASDLRTLPGFREDLEYVMETEGMWPGQSPSDYSEDAKSQRSFSVRNSLDSERSCSTPANPARIVHVTFPEGQVLESEAFSVNVPVKYQVTIHEDNTNILYNVDKTEYKTYALRNQSESQPSVIPDTIHVNLTESVTSETCEKIESTTKEDISFHKPDDNEQSTDDSLILEKSFRSSVASEREILSDSGAILHETVKQLTEKTEEKSCSQVPLRDNESNKRKGMSNLHSSGIVASTDYSGNEEVLESKCNSAEGNALDGSDTTSDYGAFTSIDGRKGLVCYGSDSEEVGSVTPSVSPRPSHISVHHDGNVVQPNHECLNIVPEQGSVLEAPQENIRTLPVQSENLCSIQDIVTPSVIAARLYQTSPTQFVCNQYSREADKETSLYEKQIDNSELASLDLLQNEPHSAENDQNAPLTVLTIQVNDDKMDKNITQCGTSKEKENVASDIDAKILPHELENVIYIPCESDKNDKQRENMNSHNQNGSVKQREISEVYDPVTNTADRTQFQNDQVLCIQSPINSPRSFRDHGSSLSSADEIYLSLEKLETSVSSSDYHTPQQSPRDKNEDDVCRLVADVEIPDMNSDKSSASPTPREGKPLVDGLADDIRNGSAGSNKPTDVRTVSVNTEALSLVSHTPAITQQTFFDENDPIYTEKMRKELKKKIATLKHKVRSLSDSAISSDFTDGDSSPRGSRFYDPEKQFGENRLRYTGTPSSQGIYNTSQSPNYESKIFHFESSSVKKSLFTDSGNVYDHEDDGKDSKTTKEKEDESICVGNSLLNSFVCEPHKYKNKSKETSQMLEQALELEYIPRSDAVELFPERLVEAILAIKPYPYPRSASLDCLSARVNVDTRLSRAVRNIPAKKDAPRGHQEVNEQTAGLLLESDSAVLQERKRQGSEDLELQELDVNQNFMPDHDIDAKESQIMERNFIDDSSQQISVGEHALKKDTRDIELISDLDNKTRKLSDNKVTGKSTSMSDLDALPNKEIHRSLSEGNIDDFNDHNSSSSSSDSITFVFVDRYQQRNPNDEDVIYMEQEDMHLQEQNGYEQGIHNGNYMYQSTYDTPDEISASESQSPDSRPISGLAPSGTESEDYSFEINIGGKVLYHDGFPGGLQSEEVLGRTDSRHSGSCVDIIDQSSSHSGSEEIEEIGKINGGISQMGDSREISVRLDNASPTTHTEQSDEPTHSDGLDQNITHSESLEDQPLRHKFGIDESVLPMPERPMSADNLPKHRLKFKDIQRSRSADMLDVGGSNEPESEEGIFPPAVINNDEAQTDPSVSLRTMSEGGIDHVSQRTVSELGVTYSSRTSSELDSVTSSSGSSVAKVQAVHIAESCSENSDSEEQFHEEEIIIHFAKPVTMNQIMDYDSLSKSPSSASEGEVDPAVFQDDDHIREVIRTVEKFIMPKQTLVDHGTSMDDESCSRYASVGIQTSLMDSSTQTTEANPVQVNPDQIILPALAAPFRAQSMDSFGLGANMPGLVLPEGAENWCTLGELMIETTNLLKRINERLPYLDKTSSVSSTEESQAILQKWREISVQTGYSLADLTTIGLQTDESLTGFNELLRGTGTHLKTSVESTQTDTQFKIEPLNMSETSVSDIIPGPAETISCEISIQTDPATSEVSVLETVEMSFHPDDKTTYDTEKTNAVEVKLPVTKTADSNLLESESEMHYRRDTKVILPADAISRYKAVESYLPLATTKQDDKLENQEVETQDTVEQVHSIPQCSIIERPVYRSRQISTPLKQTVTLSSNPSVLPAEQGTENDSVNPNRETSSKLPILSTKSPELEELRKEHAKLIENLRKATDGRKERQGRIKARKHVPESLIDDTQLENESATLKESLINESDVRDQIKQKETEEASFSDEPNCETEIKRDDAIRSSENKFVLSPASPQEIVKINIQSDQGDGIKVENTTYKSKEPSTKMLTSGTKLSADSSHKKPGMLYEQTWQLAGDGIMTISEEKPALTSDHSRTESNSSYSSDGTTESEIAAVMAGHDNLVDPVEYAAARAGALNPLFKNETDIIDDVLGNDILKAGSLENVEPEPVTEKMTKTLRLKPEILYGDYMKKYVDSEEVDVPRSAKSKKSERDPQSDKENSSPQLILPEEETIIPRIYTRNSEIPTQFLSRPKVSEVTQSNDTSADVTPVEPSIDSRERTLIEERDFIYKSETSPKFKTPALQWPSDLPKSIQTESISGIPVQPSSNYETKDSYPPANTAGALNPLFKNETDIIDDVLGNDILRAGSLENAEPEPVTEKMIKTLRLKPEIFCGDYMEKYADSEEINVPGPAKSKKSEDRDPQSDKENSSQMFLPEEETIVPRIYTKNSELPTQFLSRPKVSEVNNSNDKSAHVTPIEPSIDSRERTLTEERDFIIKSETSPKFKTPSLQWPSGLPKSIQTESISGIPVQPSSNYETKDRYSPANTQLPAHSNDQTSDMQTFRQSAPPRFGQSDDSTQVSMEFSDDFTQTDLDTSAETVIHVQVGKDQLENRQGDQSDNIIKVHSETQALSSSPVRPRPGISNSMTRELERLQNERGEIMELLSLNYLPTSLTVELLEAKLNYCIGQTDLLLGSLDDNFKPTDKSKGTVVDPQFAKEYIAKYRADLRKSKQDILLCRERLQKSRRSGSGRGRTRFRNQDLFHARRLAQIEAFRLERMREQQDYERSRCSTPVKGNTPLRGNTPLKGNSPIVTPRSNLSRDSSPDYSPAYMTPKEHKAHFGDLRKQLIKNVLDEERQHTRSCSPILLGHHPPSHRSLDTSLGFSPKVSVSVSDIIDRDISTYVVAPQSYLDSPRTSSVDRYSHLSASYYQHAHPKHELDTKTTAESIFSPQESEQILREIREIQQRTQMSAPVEETLRSSSFSSTHSHRSVDSRGGLSPQAPSKRISVRHRSSSPTTRHQDTSLNLNLDYLHDSGHGDLEDVRPYSPYSAYAREHVLPNERLQEGGILRGTFELYDSMSHDRSRDRSHDRTHDRSHDFSALSHDSDNYSDSPLSEQRLSRLRPVRSSDVKARLSRHKR